VHVSAELIGAIVGGAVAALVVFILLRRHR